MKKFKKAVIIMIVIAIIGAIVLGMNKTVNAERNLELRKV